ncbi:MAG: hypothetical protein LBJ35_01155 [Spirochaetaceae bacterium]|jgi:hypothetical protein|nr:hypothetical protein [Spirochaetaceae bacterium]
MKTKKLIFAAAALCLILAGCETVQAPADLEYSERWEKTRSGMSLEEFKEVWPRIKWAGETLDGKTIYMNISPFVEPPSLGFDYFLFESNQFIRSGLFLYTTTPVKQRKDYDMQLFIRNSMEKTDEER